MLGVHNDLRDAPGLPEEVRELGFDVTGAVERPHPEPGLVYRAVWIDAR